MSIFSRRSCSTATHTTHTNRAYRLISGHRTCDTVALPARYPGDTQAGWVTVEGAGACSVALAAREWSGAARGGSGRSDGVRHGGQAAAAALIAPTIAAPCVSAPDAAASPALWRLIMDPPCASAPVLRFPSVLLKSRLTSLPSPFLSATFYLGLDSSRSSCCSGFRGVSILPPLSS